MMTLAEASWDGGCPDCKTETDERCAGFGVSNGGMEEAEQTEGAEERTRAVVSRS